MVGRRLAAGGDRLDDHRATPRSAKGFGDRLLEAPRSFADRTSISGAIEFAMGQFAHAPYNPPRRTIDVSGDGTNNAGRDVASARDEALAQGVTINGLVILSETPLAWNPDHTNPPGGLDNYYRNNVIGGPGAFVMVAQDFNSFGQAIVKKMIAEVAQAHAKPRLRTSVRLAASDRTPGARCSEAVPDRHCPPQRILPCAATICAERRGHESDTDAGHVCGSAAKPYYPAGLSEHRKTHPVTAATGLKRLAIAVAAVIAAVFVTLVALSFLIPAASVRDAVAREIHAVTGLDPVLRGDVSVSLFPSGTVRFHDVLAWR